MKKIFKSILTTLFVFLTLPVVCACSTKKSNELITNDNTNSNVAILATTDDKMPVGNAIWVGTFQIVWNEVIDNLIHRPIEFIQGTPKIVQNLNKMGFRETDISENSYYTKYGVVSPELKKEIELGIKQKFNETSDILDSFDFTYKPMNMFFYAMLKKDFQFLQPFDKLPKDTFGENKNETVKYFGIEPKSNKSLYENVEILFYNSSDDYAVILNTQTNDKVILYRTNEEKKFSEYFKNIKSKDAAFQGSKYFRNSDSLKIPDISLYLTTSFKDVEGKSIKNSNFQISQTLETIDFKMNNEGVKLKSEAAIVMMRTGMPPRVAPEPRYFYFDKKFVLFLIEEGKDVPYYAMKITDAASLNKTGKK